MANIADNLLNEIGEYLGKQKHERYIPVRITYGGVPVNPENIVSIVRACTTLRPEDSVECCFNILEKTDPDSVDADYQIPADLENKVDCLDRDYWDKKRSGKSKELPRFPRNVDLKRLRTRY